MEVIVQHLVFALVTQRLGLVLIVKCLFAVHLVNMEATAVHPIHVLVIYRIGVVVSVKILFATLAVSMAVIAQHPTHVLVLRNGLVLIVIRVSVSLNYIPELQKCFIFQCLNLEKLSNFTLLLANCHLCSGSSYNASCSNCVISNNWCTYSCDCLDGSSNLVPTSITLQTGVGFGCQLENYAGTLNCSTLCT